MEQGVRAGNISARDVFSTLNKWRGLNTALRRVIGKEINDDKVPISALWSRALLAFSSKVDDREIDAYLGDSLVSNKSNTVEELSYVKEAALSMKLAKEVIEIQRLWRINAVRHLNCTGRYSRSLANSATDWPCILVELLSKAAEIDHFQVRML